MLRKENTCQQPMLTVVICIMRLALHGSDDRMVPLARGQALAEMIGTARLYVIPGGGHSPVHRSMEGRQAVIGFIQEIEH
jgi:pimeloyl-ACP methyl ester carboxylesterase